jgi:hypothetical protein
MRHSNATLDVLSILSNERGAWIDGLKMLQKDGWTAVASQDLVLDAEQKDASMAVDMEIGRRAAVFVGNVVRLLVSSVWLLTYAIQWSALPSNMVYKRLLDTRDPLSIRFM